MYQTQFQEELKNPDAENIKPKETQHITNDYEAYTSHDTGRVDLGKSIVIRSPIKVFLMRRAERFQQHSMKIVDKHQLVLESQESVSSPKKGASFVDPKPVVHDLRTHRVSSIDSVNQRLLCKSNRHFCVKIESREGFRKLYFLTYQHMIDAVDFMLFHGQNISRREFQYSFLESVTPQII